MQFGYFDDKNREYVITRPDTPAPWVNYLGSPEYGAIVSNNAGGYSFAKSGANGRILRYVFNQFDEPGRYIYVRDNDTEDFWSTSWMPVKKSLEEYKTVCCHGTAYTRMETEYSEIETKTVYYVPMNETYEVWSVSVKNKSDRDRHLGITGYAEFTCNSKYEQDQVNLQYSQFITRTIFEENFLTQQIHGNVYEVHRDDPDGNTVEIRFFGLAGEKVQSYCGDKEEFLGRYHGYGSPKGVEQGNLGNILNYNENSCGALTTEITLAPGETRHMVFLVGMHDSDAAKEIVARYAEPAETVEKELEELKKFWHQKLSSFQVKTPCPEFDSMINNWHAYNCFMTFIWSRAASYIYCGLRNGYGYRDTVQDIQGIIHLAPEMAQEKIRFMLSAQVDNGGGLPLVKFTHNAGHEDTPDDESYVRETGHPAYRADDALWLFPTVYKYLSETGNLDFLNEVIPYANKDEGTVYDHLKRAIDFSMNHLGTHGMPAGLHADWNDCLRLGKDGESTFVALQFYLAMTIMRKAAIYQKDTAYIEYLDREQEKLGGIIQKICWNEDRFIRGITEDGQIIGNREAPEANMWLNPQSWAVISGLATDAQAELILESVNQILNTDYGVMLMQPPYKAHAFKGALSVIYNAGVKENSGIFSQTQGWIILAEALRGHGNRAFQYYMENSPAAQNDRAEIRKLEPYCYGQFTEGKDSPHFGRSHVHWLTGTASTVMVGSVEGILGIRPDFYGLKLSPSIPAEWDGFEVEKEFRGKHLKITVHNPNHAESGFVSMTVNGKKMDTAYIPEEVLEDRTEIVLYIS